MVKTSAIVGLFAVTDCTVMVPLGPVTVKSVGCTEVPTMGSLKVRITVKLLQSVVALIGTGGT